MDIFCALNPSLHLLWPIFTRRRSRKYWTRGRNSINYQAEPGGSNYFFVLHIKANRGRAPAAPPLNPRLFTRQSTILTRQIHIRQTRHSQLILRNLIKSHIYCGSYRFTAISGWCIRKAGIRDVTDEINFWRQNDVIGSCREKRRDVTGFWWELWRLEGSVCYHGLRWFWFGIYHVVHDWRVFVERTYRKQWGNLVSLYVLLIRYM